ncbi:hypothetical protein HNQ94_002605 [Salirhabdus euzebyi]|uniref:Intracellular proteinase inhibitor BsuPI domain-containing protein n=1 Tax=Salirhabdus euzebyi TaxID=394506 RepID=A0A841Q735_9BACI|nr:BsuPI-related putative proteinase inhibitor [Salirhabdus euzebyi]MBB6454154.1 hypothetical protein [Salirhabdus euzebyi]
MKKLILFLLLGIFLVGCGTSNAESNDGDDTSGSGNEKGIVSGEVVPTLTEIDNMNYRYQIFNQTEKELTLEFTSGQRFDYAVDTKDGERVYLFSSLASFIQEVGEEKVKPGEKLSYEINLEEAGLEPGEYVLTVWMTPKDGEKYETSVDVTIE